MLDSPKEEEIKEEELIEEEVDNSELFSSSLDVLPTSSELEISSLEGSSEVMDSTSLLGKEEDD